MDPWVRSFQTIAEDDEQAVVKTGFGAIMRKRFDFPMPESVGWEIDTFDKLEAVEFDDPADRRRFFEAGDNHIAGVGDGFERNSRPWIDSVKRLHPDFAVYGSMMECSECLTRLIGQQNTMLWIGLYPDRMGRAIERIGRFYLDCLKAQIQAAGGLLDGMVIWGDMAYRNSMFFSPTNWRGQFRPWVEAMVSECHAHGLPVIYHGCGNALPLFDDLIESGIDGYNTLEAKAGLDVVELKQHFTSRLAFNGNINVQVLETNDREKVRAEVLRKLSAARGGGYIFQSDHSISSNVDPATYDYVVHLAREHGRYPLKLDSTDLEKGAAP